MQVDDLILVSVDDHVVEPPDLFEGRLSAKAAERAPFIQTLENGPGGLDVRGLGPAQRRAQRRRRAGAGGVRARPARVLGDAGRVLRHPRAHPRHERQRRARVAQLPQHRRVHGPALLHLRRQGHRHRAAAGLQRLARRGLVRHLPGAHDPAARPARLGPRAHGRRGAAHGREGLPRGHLLGEPGEAGAPELAQRPLGPLPPRLRGGGHGDLPAHRLVVRRPSSRPWTRRSTR